VNNVCERIAIVWISSNYSLSLSLYCGVTYDVCVCYDV